MDYKLFARPLTAKDFATPEARTEVFRILNYTASGQRFEAQRKQLQTQIQAFTGPGDFETTIHEVIRKYQALPVFDTGYEQIFDMIDARQSNDDGFTIYDVEDTLTFSKVPIGKKALVYGMSGTKVDVGYDLYSAGLAWHRTLIQDRKFWQLEMNAKVFINKANYTKAGSFYALIEAVGAPQNLAWQNPEPSGLAATDPNYFANRDAQTLNAAAEKIFLAVKDKGYGVNYNTPVKVVCPFQMIGRLNRALGLLSQGFAGSPSQVSYVFQLVPTTMLSSTSYYYVCLPKNKLVGGNRMDLEIYDQFSPESFSDTAYGWMRFGGAVGDQEQIVRCAKS
jgi:hypothetical protein